MQQAQKKLLLVIVCLVVVSLACTIGQSRPGDETETPTGQGTTTGTQESATPTGDEATETATQTPESTGTGVPTATHTAVPCDLVGWGSDITVPDGKKFNPGESFTKTWELYNIGSCPWTSGYQVVFAGGDQMGAASSQAVTAGTVASGNSVQISIDMTAPNSPGTYQGNWKLKNPSGGLFSFDDGNPFYVKIVVRNFTDTPEPTDAPAQPDLQINLLELNPSTPTKGDSVDVKVQVYNYGNQAAGAFTVAWYPGEHYPSPACTWAVASLAAHGGRVLTCTYAGYPSQYASINTVAIADTSDTIDESNEGNNDRSMNIKVNP